MKKNYFITLLLFLCASAIYAQHYSFEKSEATYVPLTNSTPLFTENWMELNDAPPFIKMPFAFSIYGESIETIYFGGGKLIMDFEREDRIYATGILATPDLVDLAFLDIDSDIQTEVSTQIEGANGSRILKIQVSNAGSFYEATELDDLSMTVSFQIWLYEGTNLIAIHYGPNTITDFEDFTEDGIMAVGLFQFSYDNEDTTVPSNVIEKTALLSGNSASPILKENSTRPSYLVNYPAEGLIYSFTPSTLSVEKTHHPIEAFSVFPNPTTNILNLSGNFQEGTSYTITDLGGKKLIQGAVNQHQTIDVSQLSSGLYFLKLDQSRQVVKFIKK